ncbi:MAG: dockerin type I repeat-containing protein [Ruminococcus sp.]|nr:dockerin type I repeat-containing protein [Ruminococcus sp.]
MGIRTRIASLLSVLLVTSTMSANVFAQDIDANGTFKIVNAPSGAEYSVYVDINKNYIYDDFEDTFVCSFVCNDDGVGYVEGLDEGNYVAVLQTDYTGTYVSTDDEYAFFCDGKGTFTQEAFVTNAMFTFNGSRESSEDTVNIDYDVPLFKQSGPLALEWSSLKINNSSETMGWVGCLICCFAMMRSYEVGYEIYPNQMMNTYSSDTGIGVVYSASYSAAMSVPKSASNYGWTVYGSTSLYGGNGEIASNQKNTQALFKTLYEKLQNGPVIFGGYSTYNGRSSTNHWVVVKGYSGDGVNFSAEDFFICDPANNNGVNRTTLAEYQEKYPYWDRLVYNEVSVENTLLGDVNDDGLVNSADLLALKRYTLGLMDIDAICKTNSDLNSDGIINSADVFILKRVIVSD